MSIVQLKSDNKEYFFIFINKKYEKENLFRSCLHLFNFRPKR